MQVHCQSKKAVPAEKLVSARLTIRGNTYSLVSNKKQHDVELKLDPSKSPKEIAMTFLDGPNKDLSRGRSCCASRAPSAFPATR